MTGVPKGFVYIRSVGHSRSLEFRLAHICQKRASRHFEYIEMGVIFSLSLDSHPGGLGVNLEPYYGGSLRFKYLWGDFVFLEAPTAGSVGASIFAGPSIFAHFLWT